MRLTKSDLVMKAIVPAMLLILATACDGTGTQSDYWHKHVKQKYEGKSCDFLAGVLSHELDSQYGHDAEVFALMVDAGCITTGDTR